MQRSKFLLLVAVLLCIALWRDTAFNHYNLYLVKRYYLDPDNHYVLPWHLAFLKYFTYTFLYYFKVAFILFFAGLYFIVGNLLLAVFFKTYTRKFLLGIYVVLFVASILFYLIGNFISNEFVSIDIPRFLSTMLETPATTMVLWMYFFVKEKVTIENR